MTGLHAAQRRQGVAAESRPGAEGLWATGRPLGANRIVLVRHGESQCNLDGVVGGMSGCTGLSAAGKEQAERLAERLAASGALSGAVALWSSVLPRAIQTAEAIAGAVGGHDVRTDCSLCELHPGEGDGLSWNEFLSRYGVPNFSVDPVTPVAPGAEGWSGFLDRAAGALAGVAAASPRGTIVVASHGGVIQASMIRWLGLPHEGTRAGLRPEYTSLTEWEANGGDIGAQRWRLVRYNDVSHLG